MIDKMHNEKIHLKRKKKNSRLPNQKRIRERFTVHGTHWSETLIVGTEGHK